MSEEIQYEIFCSGNIHEPYMPTEFAWIDYKNSWKKCKCGRTTHFNDNFCPSCGQRLDRPRRPE